MLQPGHPNSRSARTSRCGPAPKFSTTSGPCMREPRTPPSAASVRMGSACAPWQAMAPTATQVRAGPVPTPKYSSFTARRPSPTCSRATTSNWARLPSNSWLASPSPTKMSMIPKQTPAPGLRCQGRARDVVEHHRPCLDFRGPVLEHCARHIWRAGPARLALVAGALPRCRGRRHGQLGLRHCTNRRLCALRVGQWRSVVIGRACRRRPRQWLGGCAWSFCDVQCADPILKARRPLHCPVAPGPVCAMLLSVANNNRPKQRGMP